MKSVLIGALACAAIACGSANAADLRTKAPVLKAPPPVAAPAVYNWSGFYIGGHIGYQWADVHDVAGAFVADSTVREWMGGVHGGAQWQFAQNPWGAWVVGIEVAGSFPGEKNSVSNFTPCANPAFLCGIRKIDDLMTVGGRLGIAMDQWLFTVSGGWASAKLNRNDFFIATGVFCAGGGCSNVRHNGEYVGVGLEYLLYRSSPVALIAGADYQHVWLNDHGDADGNGVVHNLKASLDLVRFRLTAKFNPGT